MKHQSVSEQSHCPYQRPVSKGIGHHEESLVGREENDLDQQEEVGPVAKINQEILAFVFEVGIDPKRNQNWRLDSIIPGRKIAKRGEGICAKDQLESLYTNSMSIAGTVTHQGKNQGRP